MGTDEQSLSGYVPWLVSRRLAAGPIVSPETRSTAAAVLLTDLEGFTAHVESFTEHGRAGLEELARALNGYFADLVGLVYAHGGDVLSIAGDAFLCYWPATGPEGLPEAVLRASQAGLAIQSALDGRPIGHGRHFNTRLAVSAGQLDLSLVGGVNGKWELIASGLPVTEVAAAVQVFL